MYGPMLTRAAWISALMLLAGHADAVPALYGDGSTPAWIGAVLEEQWLLLDPLLGAGVVAGTLLAGWNGHLRRQITKRQRAERVLRAAALSAESASRAKSDFLAIASHEIRTPLNAVAGMLELGLKEAAAGQDVQDHLRVAHGAAQSLLDLVGNILDLERMDCGKLELLPQRANLRALSESVVRVFEGMARDKHLALHFRADDGADADVLVDAMRFKQILSNLLSNAVKFTQAGHVAVRVDARRAGSTRLAVAVQVADTGIGISAADQQALFAPYAQTRDGARIHGGSGLGLSIARRLSALMGGTLRLESAPGRGCTVRFDFEARILPMRRDTKGDPHEASTRHTPLQILAVDDNAPSRLLLRKQLEHLGHRVVLAGCGNAAWRVWRPGAYDVVMTDCNMAEGSGYALARRIRQAEAVRGNGRCTMWAYTASAEQDDIDRCMHAGMDACLLKPLSLMELRRRLAGPMNGQAWLDDAWRQGLRFDPGAIDALAGGDGTIADRFLAALVDTSEQDATALCDALATGRYAEASDVLHALVGVARMIDARTLADACVAAQRALSRRGVGTRTDTADVADAADAASVVDVVAADMANVADAADDACRAAQEELALLTRSLRAWVEAAARTGQDQPAMIKA